MASLESLGNLSATLAELQQKFAASAAQQTDESARRTLLAMSASVQNSAAHLEGVTAREKAIAERNAAVSAYWEKETQARKERREAIKKKAQEQQKAAELKAPAVEVPAGTSDADLGVRLRKEVLQRYANLTEAPTGPGPQGPDWSDWLGTTRPG